MEDQELEAGMISLRKKKAMALPLTLVFILVGAVLVGAALYVVENMHSTSRHVVTETQLYNAAQSGIEKAKMVLWEQRKDLDLGERKYTGELIDIRARKKNASKSLDEEEGLWNMSIDGLPGVEVTVDILDCNYVFDGVTYDNLQPPQIADLPPRWPGGEGGAGEDGGTEGPPEGTSAIIDPSRFFHVGGSGMSGEKRFVIRSAASEVSGGQQVKIEVMVVLKP
jgi:hypothetical protein